MTKKVTFTRRQNPPPGLDGMGYSFSATPDPQMTPPQQQQPQPFTSATFFVGDRLSSPSPSTNPNANHEVGFALTTTTTESESETDKAPTGSEQRFGGFMLSSTRFFVVEDDGYFGASLFCAFPSAENPKIWELRWNVTNDVPERAHGLPVTLRSAAYPRDTKAEYHFGTRCLTLP